MALVQHLVLERDRKDEPYLDLALSANARYLISRDKDLLDLMQDVQFRTYIQPSPSSIPFNS